MKIKDQLVILDQAIDKIIMYTLPRQDNEKYTSCSNFQLISSLSMVII